MRAVRANRNRRCRRRGAVAVFAAIMLPLMLAFTALSVDVGYLYVTRGQLQNAADAAALAGASAYFTDAGLAEDTTILTQVANLRAGEIAGRNIVLGHDVLLSGADVTLGQHDFANPGSSLSPQSRWNAVQVVARRAQDSPNGPVPLFFAGIFGRYNADLIATARAVAYDRAAGYRIREDGAFVPFVIDETLYEQFLVSGPDEYSYDDGVIRVPDGIREAKLFPWKQFGGKKSNGDDGGANEGAGNFGTLNIGVGDQGTPTLCRQITEGLSAAELQAEFGTSELRFYDTQHTQDTGPRLYQATGNPGMSSGMESAIEARVGDGVAFFLHRGVSGSGVSAVYQISGVAFGRVMAVQLNGNPDDRALVVQTAPHVSSNVITDSNAPSSSGAVGRIFLVR